MSDDVHLLVGAYAVGALSDDEARAFEAHLATCESCATELPGLLETAARLGAVEHVPPPDSMRSAVLAAAASTRQLPPQVTPLRRPPRWRRVAVAAGVALLAGGAGVGAQALRWEQEADRARAHAAAVATVLTAPDAEVATAAAAEGRAAVVWSPSAGRAVFLASGLPELAEDRVYQLWYVGEGDPRSAGLLPDGGRTQPLRPEPGTQLVALTVEPEGGSSAPTTAPLLAVPLGA